MLKINEDSFNLTKDDRKIRYYNEDTMVWFHDESTGKLFGDEHEMENEVQLGRSTVILIEPGKEPKIVDDTHTSYEELIYTSQDGEELEGYGLEIEPLYTWSKDIDGERYLGDDMTLYYGRQSDGRYNFATKTSYVDGEGNKGEYVKHIRGNAVIVVSKGSMASLTVTKTHLDKIKELFIESETIDGITTWALGG